MPPPPAPPPAPPSDWKDPGRLPFLCAAAFFALFAVARSAGVLDEDRGNNTTYLLGLALVALVLPEITKLTINKDGFTLEKAIRALNAKVDAVQSSTAELSSVVTSGVGGKAPEDMIAASRRPSPQRTTLPGVEAKPPVDPEDPNLGAFGGQPSRDGFTLSASVTESSLQSSWFRIQLLLTSDLDPTVAGTVEMHLHPTFQQNKVAVPIKAGRARLDLTGWGAFTVGAVVSVPGREPVLLELNLAKVPGAPAVFVAH